LFVYGTLRREGPAHRRLDGARFVATGTIAGTLYDLGRFPGVHRAARARTRVAGEVYEMNVADAGRMVAALDRYEGPLFRRARVRVRLDGGGERVAWTYLLADAPPRRARPIAPGTSPRAPRAGGG
jgi:gamma-glutamylcyclotransferase (GGCT)/AIG2-like uncharacterized protein YtfP